MISFRALAIILFCFVTSVLTRCSCCKCEDIDLKYSSTIKEMEITSLDNSGKDTVPVVNQTVNKSAYALRLSFLSTTAVLAHQTCPQWNLFIGEANAMSCGCNNYARYVPTDSIRTITITDLEPFDATTPALADITSKFRYYNRYPGNYITIENLISDPTNSLYYPSYYTGPNAASAPVLETAVTFLLMEPPAEPGQHRFKVSVQLQSGLTLEQTTSAITLE